MTEAPAKSTAKRRYSLILLGALGGLVVGLAAVYGIAGLTGNAGGDKACQPAVALAKTLAPLAHGEVAAVNVAKSGLKVPDLAFQDASGKPVTLANWRGRTVLLNLWATWCIPCRKEMPALDRLQKELGSDQFEVVAMSVDRAGAAASQKFLDEIKVSNLKLYSESTTKSVGLLRAPGLPTTILVDREGREIGRLAGPAEWDGTDAKRLIQSVLKPS